MQQPLVSILITLFNGEKFIGRTLESCIRQTYKNIEIIALDDASTDSTGTMVKEYAKKDVRIKYFKNKQNIGYSLSLTKLPEFAAGKYAQLLGADDWLSRDYIEKTVKSFERNPKAACVAAKIITLDLLPDNRFRFSESFLPRRKTISRDFYIKNVYKTDLGATFTPLALFRREDFLESADFIRSVFTNPPIPIPSELQKLHFKGHATGTLFLLKTIRKYKEIVLTDEAAYIKTQNFQNKNKPHNFIIDWTSAGNVLRSYYFDRLDYECLFKTTYRDFWNGYRSFFGADPFVSILFMFIKSGFKRGFFADFKWKDVKAYFSDYSFLEKIFSVFYFPIRFTARALAFLARPFDFSRSRRLDVFRANYFLDKKGHFAT